MLSFTLWCVLYNLYRPKASTTLSLDLCPEFMRDGVGQASFLFHISQQFLPILEGISVQKTKIKMWQVSFHTVK